MRLVCVLLACLLLGSLASLGYVSCAREEAGSLPVEPAPALVVEDVAITGPVLPPPPPACMVTPDPAAGLRVRVQVLTEDHGEGNPLWTATYIQRLLGAVQATAVPLQVTQYARSEVHDSTLFPLDRVPVFLTACPGQEGVLTIVIWHPDPGNDAAGLSQFYVLGGVNTHPCFVMRSRYAEDTPETVAATALIFLHELGHQLGYQHTYDQRIHTDNYWLWADGQAVLQQFVTALDAAYQCQP